MRRAAVLHNHLSASAAAVAQTLEERQRIVRRSYLLFQRIVNRRLPSPPPYATHANAIAAALLVSSHNTMHAAHTRWRDDSNDSRLCAITNIRISYCVVRALSSLGRPMVHTRSFLFALGADKARHNRDETFYMLQIYSVGVVVVVLADGSVKTMPLID